MLKLNLEDEFMHDNFNELNNLIALLKIEYKNFDTSYESRCRRYNIAIRIRDLYKNINIINSVYWNNIFPHWNSLNETSFTPEDILFILDNLKKIKKHYYTQYFDKIFISHSEKDKNIISEFISLLHAMGIKRPAIDEDGIIFCSSYKGYSIDNRENNIVSIKNELISENNILALVMYSKNYMQSPACLNEMGAIWVNDIPYQPIILPQFAFKDIDGFLDHRTTGFEIADKFKLNDFKDEIQKYFNLPTIAQNIWEQDRDKFLETISDNKSNNTWQKI